MTVIKFSKLYRMLSSPRGRNIYVRVEKTKRKFINNYGEIPLYINEADGDPWDVIIPGYPKLQYQQPYEFKELLGVYLLPNQNHKLIIDIHTDIQKNFSSVQRDVSLFKKRYEQHTKLKGTVIYF